LKGNAQESALQRWMWVLIALCFTATVATICLTPVSWPQYWQYVLAQFGFPLLAAILTAACLLVVSLLAAGRRRTSGFVALGMFISIIAHMLAASLFGLYVLSTPAPEMEKTEGKLELSSSVPPMVESLLSQDMRAQFTATTKPDLRELAAKKKAQVDPVEARAAQLKLELKHGPLPEPMQEKVKPVEASLAKAQVKEALSKTEETLPDVNKAKLVALAQMKDANEAAPAKPAPRELPRQAPLKVQIDTPAAPTKVARNVQQKNMQRTLERDTVDIASIRGGGRKPDEILQAGASAGKVDALKFKAEQIQDANDPGRMEMKRKGEPSPAMELAHQEGGATPDAPAARMLSREVKGTRARTTAASLSDATPMTRQSRPSVDATAQQRNTSRARFLSEPVRMIDTQRLVAGPTTAAPAAEPVVNAQKEVLAGRSGQKTAIQGEDIPLNTPRASISLQGRQAEGAAALGTTSTREAAPAGTDRPALQEQLLAALGKTGTQPLVDVGGSAAGISAEHTQSSMTAHLTGRDDFGGVASAKSVMTQENIPDGTRGRLSRHSVNLTSAGNHTDGTGERTTFDVPGTQSQPPPHPAGDTNELASAITRSLAMAMVDMGGTAAPAATRASGSADARGESHGVMDELRHELSTGKNQGDGGWGQQGDAVFAQRPDTGRVLSGTGGSHNSLAGAAADGAIGGLSGTTAAPMDATMIENPGTAAGAGATVVDILSGTVREMASEDTGIQADGGKTQPARASIGLNLEKADAGLSPTGEQGARSQLSLPTTARAGNSNVSLADVNGLSAAQPRGTQGSGIGQDSMTPVKSGSAAGNEARVAFGASGRELVAEGMDKGDSTTVSPASKNTAEILVAKAGGQFMPDGAPAGDGLMDFDSSSMSSSSGRPHARMDMDLNAGTGGQGGHSARPAVGDSGQATPRLLISDELASVPKTVPEKALYKLRTPEKRKEIIRQLGGSDKTEQAVEDALIWLAGAQSDDGRWDVDGFKSLSRCGGGRRPERG